jgi:flagellar basal body rod protein FlgG
MDRGLYSGLSALDAAERRVEVIAGNLANVSATGFKRIGTASHGFDAVLRGKLERGLAVTNTVDFSQGILRNTDGAYDLALDGGGFFVVETPGGEGYTRDGSFHVDANGVLQTREGFPVAWDGARGTIDPRGEEVTVDEGGNVRQGTNTVGRLALAQFAEPQSLQLDRQGYFRAPANARAAAVEGRVVQRALEGANVSAIDEMVALIVAQRSFETATRLMSSIEGTYRRLTAPR